MGEALQKKSTTTEHCNQFQQGCAHNHLRVNAVRLKVVKVKLKPLTASCCSIRIKTSYGQFIARDIYVHFSWSKSHSLWDFNEAFAQIFMKAHFHMKRS